MPATSEPVLITRPSPGVVLLTLNLPEIRNAMNERLTKAWVESLELLAAEGSVRALVVTGEGPFQ